MSRAPKEAPLDYLGLGEALAALGYPVRLALLDALRFPHTAGEVKVQPHRVDRGVNPKRTIARQTIQAHIDKLVDAGLVTAEEVDAGGRPMTYYTANPGRLYALTEELRRLSLRYAGRGHAVSLDTGTIGAPTGIEEVEGPRLLLVHGVYEGKVFELSASGSEDGASWAIGRRKDLAIALDYDPYVSQRNTLVRLHGERFVVEDLEESKNGTLVNWERLPRGGKHRLKVGDVIGVGRSLLVFLDG